MACCVHESMYELFSRELYEDDVSWELFFRGRMVDGKLHCFVDLSTLYSFKDHYDDADCRKMFLNNNSDIVLLDLYEMEPKVVIGTLCDDYGYNAIFYDNVLVQDSSMDNHPIHMFIREDRTAAVIRRWRRLRRVARRVGHIAHFVRHLFFFILAPGGPVFRRAMKRLRGNY